ncbi:MAG TPA: tRNA (N(6)-L-threonylcarbamoyladenosine(37)-C(2))-methylthiotransferase MtaB [Thermodesulfobacteriota bacterium]|nr:tRNA (N(6)-L-threonylcarbamoyladenosine(37)-C(2))-methylthiotransferase MtaB [Thermodesulfobacteriota bacterium]
MKRISVVTSGCKVNQYDTAAVLNSLPESKYEKVPFPGKADIYLIDTCTVTHKADAEARHYINRAKRINPKGIVIVTGCYAQVSSDELREMAGVDYIVGNSDKFSSLFKIIQGGEAQPEPSVFVSDLFKEKKRRFESPEISHFPERTRAFLKVQDGCNYRCTFCIIPYARGRSRSLDVDEVLRRMDRLAGSGYKEVVLTGVHLASYGRDIGTNLLHLLMGVEKAKIMKRIRLSSLDPADTTDELIRFVAESETVCPSFHIALQSGDTNVLKRMRRRYKPEGFLHCTELIREKIPDAAIGTDIMVGFPGETDEEFENTYNLAKVSALTYFHVFPYSKRKNTPAANMPNRLHPSVLKERSRLLRELGTKKKQEFYRSFIGRRFPVLIEKGAKGTTPNYISVHITDGSFSIGDEVEVEIRDVKKEEVVGAPNPK